MQQAFGSYDTVAEGVAARERLAVYACALSQDPHSTTLPLLHKDNAAHERFKANVDKLIRAKQGKPYHMFLS